MTKLSLYLGCNGNADKSGFVFCRSCSNRIFDVSSLSSEKHNKVIDFLDAAAGMFDGPVTSTNKSLNIINMLHRDFGIFKEQQIHEIQKFALIHKECGLYLALIPEE